MTLTDLPNLEDLSGLARLTQIPGDLQLYLLPKIANLDDLANLQAVGLNAVIGANNNLQSLAGLGESSKTGVANTIVINVPAGRAMIQTWLP